MFPLPSAQSPALSGLPHAGGGVSRVGCASQACAVSSPRRWGCFQLCITECKPKAVFPTQVGVFPYPCGYSRANPRLPHAGGGVSTRLYSIGSSGRVFPTQVGVFLISWQGVREQECLPHAGGGVSTALFLQLLEVWSSPRRWGCFLVKLAALKLGLVFPTQVGVFLNSPYVGGGKACLPHAGGGVSLVGWSFVCGHLSSPRRWGCFY